VTPGLKAVRPIQPDVTTAADTPEVRTPAAQRYPHGITARDSRNDTNSSRSSQSSACSQCKWIDACGLAPVRGKKGFPRSSWMARDDLTDSDVPDYRLHCLRRSFMFRVNNRHCISLYIYVHYGLSAATSPRGAASTCPLFSEDSHCDSVDHETLHDNAVRRV